MVRLLNLEKGIIYLKKIIVYIFYKCNFLLNNIILWLIGIMFFDNKINFFNSAIKNIEANYLNINSVLSVEVNLKSDNPSERTLHFFVDNKQLKEFVIDLPKSVIFGVWILFFSLLFYSIFEQINIGIVTNYVKFLTLEKLNNQTVKRSEKEKCFSWIGELNKNGWLCGREGWKRWKRRKRVLLILNHNSFDFNLLKNV